MQPLMQRMAQLAPQASRDDLLDLGLQIAAAAPEIVNCFNGAEQFPPKDPNQLELPLEP